MHACVCGICLGSHQLTPALPQLKVPHRPATTQPGGQRTLHQLMAAISCQTKTFFSSC